LLADSEFGARKDEKAPVNIRRGRMVPIQPVRLLFPIEPRGIMTVYHAIARIESPKSATFRAAFWALVPKCLPTVPSLDPSKEALSVSKEVVAVEEFSGLEKVTPLPGPDPLDPLSSPPFPLLIFDVDYYTTAIFVTVFQVE